MEIYKCVDRYQLRIWPSAVFVHIKGYESAVKLSYNLLLAMDLLCLGKPAAAIHFTHFHKSHSEKQLLHFLGT